MALKGNRKLRMTVSCISRKRDLASESLFLNFKQLIKPACQLPSLV